MGVAQKKSHRLRGLSGEAAFRFNAQNFPLMRTCARTKYGYIAIALQISRTSHLLKPLIGGLLVAFVVLLNAMAASPTLHEFFHADAGNAGHQCAVTLFAQGQVDAAAVHVAPNVPPVFAEFVLRAAVPIFSSAVQILPPGRGPPVSLLHS
jgi:hypothetical protein